MVWDHEVAGSNPATPTRNIDSRDASVAEALRPVGEASWR